MLAIDRVNICASAFIALLPTFAIFQSHTNSKLALYHGVDFAEQIRIAACDGPSRVRDCAKSFLIRAGYRPDPGECLNLPKLGAIPIVGFEGLERTDKRPLFAFGTQARIN